MPLRPPTPEDADAIVALLVACDIADFGAPDYDRDALLAEWAEPGIDLERDAVINDGGYGLLWHSDIRAWVHPDRRGQGLEHELLDRLEARARERGLDHVDRQVPRSDRPGRELLEGRGYELVRSYAEMRLPDHAVAALPVADSVRAFDPERDADAVQGLMERAFAGGAGRLESPETLALRNPDTSLWFVVDAPDGTLAAAIRSELRAGGLIYGYVSQLATEPEHRDRGHGSALLGTAARELVARGASAIRLHVRSSNPGALALYERLGFVGTWIADELRLEL